MAKKVAVGLSGGVDSAVSAALLKEQGSDVTGVFLECWKEPGCRTDQDRKDALSVALGLKLPFKVLNFIKDYKKKVVDYFYEEYRKGRTPNPDIRCNEEIKFGLFYKWAIRSKFDYMATGHYSRIRAKLKIENEKLKNTSKNSKIEYELLRGKDKRKDQSYFLYRLKQEQLSHILFPIGGMKKAEVRQEARKRGLPVADKPDSQGICFIGEVDVKELLKKRLGVKKGEVVDTEGEVIGEHDGVWFYTIGQRHGFSLNGRQKQNGQFKGVTPPVYVVKKDVRRNRLVVGFGAETYRSQFVVSDLNWLANGKWRGNSNNEPVKVRIRHGGELISCKVEPLKMRLEVELLRPQRGIAPGQSAVFYRGQVCLGGGVIC